LFIKKETVIGIIGKTQGVKIAKRPAKKENNMNEKIVASKFSELDFGLIVTS
tara:strand:+ start:331 stop:486 length:156 start_codon:yes stop_codon:yes gene_type:complete